MTAATRTRTPTRRRARPALLPVRQRRQRLEELDASRVAELLPERTRAVVERTGVPQRAHVLRDLATIALADGS